MILCTGNPLNVYDYALDSNGWPSEWIPFDSSESQGLSRWAEGGTNVIEYDTNKGLVWFLKNDRSSGQDSIVGAGVATVIADSNGPKATRADDTMWNNFEPSWGDIGVSYYSQDQNVYVFGPAPFTKSNVTGNVHLAKVPAAQAPDVSAYQFANGNLGTIDVSESQAIFTNRDMGQSNVFSSNYYNSWMFVHGADVGYTDIMVKTAKKLEGPWSTSFTIVSTCPNNQCSAIRYANAPQPEFDPTGKTLLVTWTDSNQIYAVTIEWQ